MLAVEEGVEAQTCEQEAAHCQCQLDHDRARLADARLEEALSGEDLCGACAADGRGDPFLTDERAKRMRVQGRGLVRGRRHCVTCADDGCTAGARGATPRVAPSGVAPSAGATVVPISSLVKERAAHKHSVVTSMYRVRNMCCEAEVRLVRALLGPVCGVLSADVNVVSRTAHVRHCADSACLPPNAVVDKLNSANLGASLVSAGDVDDDPTEPAGLAQRARTRAAIARASAVGAAQGGRAGVCVHTRARRGRV